LTIPLDTPPPFGVMGGKPVLPNIPILANKARNIMAALGWPKLYPDHSFTPDPSMNDGICYATIQTGIAAHDGFDMAVQCGLSAEKHGIQWPPAIPPVDVVPPEPPPVEEPPPEEPPPA
jgi:hypothetical protein